MPACFPRAELPLAGEGLFELFLEQEGNQGRYLFGREPDGSPAGPWSWAGLLRGDGGLGVLGDRDAERGPAAEYLAELIRDRQVLQFADRPEGLGTADGVLPERLVRTSRRG